MLEAEDDDNFDEFSEAISKRDRLWKVENGIVKIGKCLTLLKIILDVLLRLLTQCLFSADIHTWLGDIHRHGGRLGTLRSVLGYALLGSERSHNGGHNRDGVPYCVLGNNIHHDEGNILHNGPSCVLQHGSLTLHYGNLRDILHDSLRGNLHGNLRDNLRNNLRNDHRGNHRGRIHYSQTSMDRMPIAFHQSSFLLVLESV